MTFSEPIDPTTVDEIGLAQGGRKIQAAVNLSNDGLTATLDPRNNLAAGTRYRVTVPTAVEDTAANPLEAIKTWAFVTR